jgi:molybdenum cofactor biosynthesis enzyme
MQVITHAKKTGEILRLGRMLSFSIFDVDITSKPSNQVALSVKLRNDTYE